MSAYIDFAEVKKRVSIADVLSMLGIELKKAGNQLRGCCPIHKGDNDRQFVVTPAKNVWYCFGNCDGGGDIIELVSKVKQITQKEAAQTIALHFKLIDIAKPEKATSSSKAFEPLTYLDPEHEALKPLGLSADTLRHFEAGYAPKGIMSGRLAVPIHELDGTLIAYVGVALNGAEPRFKYPKDFTPRVFNANRVGEGVLYVARDPLKVLKAFEGGIENCVAVEEMTPALLKLLAELSEAKGVDSVELM